MHEGKDKVWIGQMQLCRCKHAPPTRPLQKHLNECCQEHGCGGPNIYTHVHQSPRCQQHIERGAVVEALLQVDGWVELFWMLLLRMCVQVRAWGVCVWVGGGWGAGVQDLKSPPSPHLQAA
jgi:hypothetical protein